MFKRKRSFYSIGKEQYNFDYEREKAIYSYLYGINKRLHKKVKVELQFCFYDDWKQYIQNKYRDYDSKRLMEFRRYLYHDIRSEKPINEYWKICIPIVLSEIIAELLEMLINFQNIETEGNVVIVILAILLSLLIIMLPVICSIYSLITPLWDSNTKENLLTDYKEVIDEMIGEKLLEESKRTQRKEK